MDVDEILDAAWKQIWAGDHTRALATLEPLRERGGLSQNFRFQLHHLRGLALRGLGQIEGALAQQLIAMELGPIHPEPPAEVAECFLDLGRYIEAMNHYNRAVAMGAKHPVTHYNQACVAAKLGNYEVVVKGLTRAIELDPSNRADALADPDFAPLLGMPELRALLRA